MSLERGSARLTVDEVVRIGKETARVFDNQLPLLMLAGSQALLFVKVRQMPDDQTGRKDWMRRIGLSLSKYQDIGALREVFFIWKSWMKQPGEGNPVSQPLSQLPARKEVLAVAALELEGHSRHLALLEVTRSGSGRLMDMRELYPIDERTEQRKVKMPFLDAFVDGFQHGRTSRLN